MRTFYDRVEDKPKKEYQVEEILQAGYNLEPIVCQFCGSHEVVFDQYIGDAYCEACGRWQLGD